VPLSPARADLTLGFGLPVSGSWATPGTVAAVARRAEELGYGSLWSFQRVVVPVDDDYGPQYRSVLDPVVALGFAAAVTGRVRLGTAVVNAPYVAPAVLAKQLATIDVLSAGRLDVGLGLGWASHEFAAVGAPWERRGARLAEYVACLRALWADDPVAFSGEFFTVPPSRMQPKPVQRPGPPILLGGSADAALRRAGRIADGWISGSRHDLTAISTALRTIRGAAEQAGRDPAGVRGAVFCWGGVDPDAARSRQEVVEGVSAVYSQDFDALADRYLLHGDPDRVAARAREYADAGADTLVFSPVGAGDRRREVVDLFTAEVLHGLR
jgi:probable F420-dependent oxidoreductase